jgi:dienelactone hydrolase
VTDDQQARLDEWHAHARNHISVEMCERLARNGMAALAIELMRQRGEEIA